MLLFSFCVLAMMADAGASERVFGVGFARSSTPDPMGGEMPYAIWYPSGVPNDTVKVGPLAFPGTEDAEPAAGPFGLVMLSHGSGGSPLGHWDTAIALAEAGFIAAGPLHPRNNVEDDIGDDQRIVLDGRPRQLSAVIDALLAQPAWSRRIDPRRIGAFGFSAGGYTVLAALGAARDYRLILEHCERHAGEDPSCRFYTGGGTEKRAARARAYAAPVDRIHDGRICAAVIADPFATPFSEAGLKALPPVKLLFFRPEVEDVLAAEFHVSRVVRLLRQRDDFPELQVVVVPKAGHYSFIGPFPDDVARRNPRLASDPEGFDRVAVHDVMNRTIVTFFRQAFSDCVTD